MPTGYAKVVTASSIGLPGDTLLRNDTRDFAPRLGMAYRPWGANTVLRGGYGIYYNNSPAQPDAASSPFVISVPTYTNTTPAPALVLPQGFPSAGVGGPSTISLPTAFNPNLRMPYTQQWSLTIEHQLGDFGLRLSYVGTATRQMLYIYDINAPVPDGQLYINKPRLFPNYPGTQAPGQPRSGWRNRLDSRLSFSRQDNARSVCSSRGSGKHSGGVAEFGGSSAAAALRG